MAEPFSYEPLNSQRNEIRLLKINSKPSEEPIGCSLIHCSLDDAPEYIALSYTWNNPFSSETSASEILHAILVNGGNLPVRENLANALQALSARQPSYYWIDAICVDQSNVSERNDQLLRMRSIYVLAVKVQIWLGPEKYESTLGLEFIEHVYERAKMSHDKTRQWLMKLAESEHYHRMWQAFMSLFQRTWWRRVWAIQEVVLAKDVEILCGKKMVHWNTLSWMRWLVNFDIRKLGLPLGADDELPMLLPSLSGLGTSFYLRRYWHKRLPLQYLFLMYRTRQALASDDRDKVFAVSGLLPPESQARLILDYSRSRDDIYTFLVKHYVEATGDLYIITLAHIPFQSNTSLPSWVPDWSKDVKITPLSFSVRMIDEDEVLRDYDASQGLKADITFSEDLTAIRCQAFYVDTIRGQEKNHANASQLAEKAPSLFQPDAFEAFYRACCGDFYWDTIARAIRELPPHCKTTFALQCLQCETSSDTLNQPPSPDTLKTTATGDEDPASPSTYFAQWYRNFSIGSFLLSNDSAREWASSQTNKFPNHSSEGHSIPTPDDFLYAVQRRTRNRRLITTETGSVGMAPASVEEGDQIYILHGCRTPVVLRPERGGKYFSLVGECYVHGVMFGEAVEGVKRGQYEVVPVELR